MNRKNLTKAILYGSWLNNQDPDLKKIFVNTFNMYNKYNVSSRFELFTRYEDANFTPSTYCHDMICIGMAKYKNENAQYKDAFYLFSQVNSLNEFSGFSCCVETNTHTTYSFNKFNKIGYIECPYISASRGLFLSFFENFKFD